MNKKYCDLVLEGGGVKGLGLVGAIATIKERGYIVRRAAGTSAGAIVGALTAAGMSAAEMRETMQTLDYQRFRDATPLDHLGIPGKGLQLAFSEGIYKGDYLKNWLAAELAKLNVHTFKDLAITEDWAQTLPPEQRYKLVVITTDVTRGRLVRLPWDYHLYGLNPDDQPVAEAVRASMSIPFFYKPQHLAGSVFVDGSMLSNFPVGMFDSTPDWPTFGVKLSLKPAADPGIDPTKNAVDLGIALFQTIMNAHDWMHLDDPATLARTMFVDTTGVSATNFDITPKQQAWLYANGQKGAAKLLDRLAAAATNPDDPVPSAAPTRTTQSPTPPPR
ncbi:MAG TPA: patatin-like phospholipase family protein [Candidatus Saccharimonadia bacterium]